MRAGDDDARQGSPEAWHRTAPSSQQTVQANTAWVGGAQQKATLSELPFIEPDSILRSIQRR